MNYHAVKVGVRPDVVAACIYCPHSRSSPCWLGPAPQNAALLASSRCLPSIVKSWTSYICSSFREGLLFILLFACTREVKKHERERDED